MQLWISTRSLTATNVARGSPKSVASVGTFLSSYSLFRPGFLTAANSTERRTAGVNNTDVHRDIWRDTENSHKNVRTWIYSLNTGGSVLRGHLHLFHYDLYLQMSIEASWPFLIRRFIFRPGTAGAQTVLGLDIQPVVPYSKAALLDYLVRFITVNNQISSHFGRICCHLSLTHPQ